MSKHRVLYLPIETKARELPGKAFLAAHAVERGWIVVTGEQSDVHRFMRESPVGAYIEISIPERKASRLEHLSKSGYRIMNLCEETLYLNGRNYCQSKLGATSLRWVDRLLALGAVNADHIMTFRPQFAHKVAVTGNPRFDTLLPPLRSIYEPRASAIRKRYGQFLLVNTNFGLHNPYQLEGDTVERLMRAGMIADQEHADFMRRQLEYERRKMTGLQALLKELAADRIVDRIVIRPHPGENHQTWRDWATPLDIDVIYEGSANEWMLAAEAVLHPGCTTGIEGLVLGRKVFSFVPEANSEYLKLSDFLSQQIASAKELAVLLKTNNSAMRKQTFPNERDQLPDYVANIRPPFATERILDELDRFDLPTVTSREVLRPNWNSLPQISRTMRNWLKQSIPQPVTRKGQKFPGIDKREFMQAADSWAVDRPAFKRPNIDSPDGRIHVWH